MARLKTSTASPDVHWTESECEDYLDRYRTMVLIRRFEELVQRLFVRDEIHGTTHLCNGQEAVSVGVSSALRPGDKVAGTYRGHGQVLALGVPPQAVLDELLGRATGINGGRAGSMNITSMDHGFMGSYGIVGATTATAVGAGLALRDSGNVAVAYFGDGATNQAYFFESMNFAAVFSLPVLFVCENNLYMEYTRTSEVSAGSINARAEALGVPATQVDGMQVWDVLATTRQAVTRASEGLGPTFIEAMTYRYVGHSRSDPARYRPEGELDEWLTRDPLKLLRARLLDNGTTPQRLDSIDDDVATEISTMEERGRAAPWPDSSALPHEFAGAVGQ